MQTKSLQSKRALRTTLLFLLLGVAGMGKGYAYDFVVDGVYYNITSSTDPKTVEVTQGNYNNDYNVIIPNSVTYNGNIYAVTRIGNNAFLNCDRLATVHIGNSVLSMGEDAFKRCNNLAGVYYADNIQQWCNISFDNESSNPLSVAHKLYIDNNLVTQLVIPEGVSSIKSYAFNGCGGFTGNLIIPNTVTTIGESAFSGCSGFTGDLIIPNSVTTIGESAFDGCRGFTGSLIIGNSVTTIGNGAFGYCYGFSGDLIIPNSVTYIGIGAFVACGFNGNLTIGNSVTTIGDGAFRACNGFTGSLIIPNSVTTIGSFAFVPGDAKSSGFTGSLTIPNSVTEIGGLAFYGCSGLTSISIPSSVSSIGSGAFGNTGWYDLQPDGILYLDGWCLGPKGNITGTLVLDGNTKGIAGGAFSGCSGLTGSLTIPSTVTTIGSQAFYECSGLTSISIPSSISSIGSGAFLYTGWYNTQPNGILYLDGWCLGYKGSLETSDTLTLAENTRGIADGAFAYCINLFGSLTIPNTVITIGERAFYNCRSLTGSLTIPNSVTTIGASAFRNCSGFNGNLTIGNSVTTIGGGAFYNCSGFTGILSIPNSVTIIEDARHDMYKPSYDFEETGCFGAFENCNGFTSLVLSNSLTKIGLKAFTGCSGFTGSLTIPNTVREIGDWAFSGCSGFTGNLTIPNSVASLGSNSFNGCSGFTGNLAISNSITSIGDGTFKNCSGLTGNLVIPNSLASIGCEAFSNCNRLMGSLIIPNGITSIGCGTFSNCSGFAGELIIPNSVLAIDYNAFYGCSSLTSVEIPNSVTWIGEYAFSNCSGLTTVLIGKSLKHIRREAFANNPRLNMIYYNVEKDLEASTDVFENCPNLTTIHIGPEVKEIGSNIFKGCNTVHFVVALGPTPAVLDAGAFSDIVDNSVLMVSCGKRVTYYSVWNMFPFNNIIEDCDTYGINVGAVGSGGTITPSVTEAQMGQEVQITITPNPGMALVSIKVVNANDPTQIIPISPSGKAASTYSFTMPPFEVVVLATFKNSGASVDENNSVEVAVYPNPTNGLLKIEAESIKHVSISNMLGQVVFNGKVDGDAFEYDFSGQKAGIYLVRIETASGVAVKKVSITR